MVPPTLHTTANRKRPCSHMVVCWLDMPSEPLAPDAATSSRVRRAHTQTHLHISTHTHTQSDGFSQTDPAGSCRASSGSGPGGWGRSEPGSDNPGPQSPDTAEAANQTSPLSTGKNAHTDTTQTLTAMTINLIPKDGLQTLGMEPGNL